LTTIRHSGQARSATAAIVGNADGTSFERLSAMSRPKAATDIRAKDALSDGMHPHIPERMPFYGE
jgi:hypothetical protein